MKKIINIVVIFLLILFSFNLEVDANTKSNTLKKVVSVVYDDSGSMNNNNEDYAYASYSMQNLVSILNKEDVLGVTKMSEPSRTLEFDLINDNSRKNDIKSIESWNVGGGTPFTAIETSMNWLKSQQNKYGENTNVEYWLIIITDGAFQNGYPTNMKEYLENYKKSMGLSKYEGVLVAIGNSVPEYIKNDWNNISGNHLITASNKNDIVNAMSEVIGLILGQGGKNSNLNIKKDGNTITFESYFPLKKFIIWQQNQKIEIMNIKANEATTKIINSFTSDNPGKEKILSYTFHCANEEIGYIPAGVVTIDFEGKVDTTSNKFKILTEAAVNNKLKVHTKSGQEIKDINSYLFKKGEIVILKSSVLSSVDNTSVDLKNFKNEIEAKIIINNQILDMKYDQNENVFYLQYEIKNDSSNIYSTITLPGYFRVKSDVINIETKKKIDNANVNVSNSTIEIPYKYTKEYEEVATFTYEVTGGVINGILNFEFKHLPKGIILSVNGVYANKVGELSTKIYNDTPVDVKIYRNKDYKETELSKIPINVVSDQYELEWQENSITEIILKPVKRKLIAEKIQTNKIINLKDLNKNDIYILSIRDESDYLSKEELETLVLNTNFKDLSIQAETIEYNGKYALKIFVENKIPKLFIKTGKISTPIEIITNYKEKTEPILLEFEIKDSITKYILPLIILILIILIIGYLPGIKKRLDSKNYCIKRNQEFEVINIKLITRLLPYVKEKGIGSDLTIVATGNKNKIIVLNNFYDANKILINDELKENINKEIEIYIDEELKIYENNITTTYKYCNTNNNTSVDNLSNMNDLDDMFVQTRETKTRRKKNVSNDDFFG